MSILRTVLMGLLAGAFAGQIVSAQSSAPQKADEVARASRQLKQQALATKGGPRARQEQAARQLQRLADDLEAGRPVDPAEIDRLLKKAEHGQW